MTPVIVLLDTNALMMISEGVNVISDLEEELATKPVYVCLESIVKELERIAESSGVKESKKARLALEVVNEKCIIVKSDFETADRDLISKALEFKSKGYRVIVATNDREIRRKLREAGVTVAFYRESKNKFTVEEGACI